MIALALAGALLSVVFHFLVANSRFSLQLEKAQQTLREQQRLRERIDSLFVSLCPTELGPSIYTTQLPKEKNLTVIATFDAGIDPDPAYSGPNRATLSFDEHHRLCFKQQPLLDDTSRTEILLSHVQAAKWEFLGPSDKKEGWAWATSWPKKNGGVPPIIRLSLWSGIDKKKEKEPNLQIAFILPQQEPIRIIKEL